MKLIDLVLLVVCGLLVLQEWMQTLQDLTSSSTVLRGFFDLIWLVSAGVAVTVWGRVFLFKDLSPGLTAALLWLVSVPIKHALWIPLVSGFPGYPGPGY